MSAGGFSRRQLIGIAALAVFSCAGGVAALTGALGAAVAVLLLVHLATAVAVLALRNQVSRAARDRRTSAQAAVEAVRALGVQLRSEAEEREQRTRRAVERGTTQVTEMLTRDERQALLQALLETMGAERLDAVHRHQEVRKALDDLRRGSTS